jgi:hypothetical protein
MDRQHRSEREQHKQTLQNATVTSSAVQRAPTIAATIPRASWFSVMSTSCSERIPHVRGIAVTSVGLVLAAGSRHSLGILESRS